MGMPGEAVIRNSNLAWSSPVAQWVKDLALSLLQWGFCPWPEKKNKKKHFLAKATSVP